MEEGYNSVCDRGTPNHLGSEAVFPKTMCGEWKLDIYYHHEGYFVVRFEKLEDKEMILGDDLLMLGE